jgi:hypothetical protein
VNLKRRPPYSKEIPAFTLIELVTVIAVLTILLLVGTRLLGGTTSQARKAGTDLLTGMIEQARTMAVSSRTHVVLAIAEPGDLPARDERCRLALIKVDEWPENPGDPVKGVLMTRWRTLETGAVLLGGDVDGVANPLDVPQLDIHFGPNHSLKVEAHALAFHSRGGLRYPEGSTPVAMRVAEGGYRGGAASPNRNGDAGTISEDRLKIGRVTARPYRTDG